jgi:hypothetical protein
MSVFAWDWMHCYFIDGVFVNEFRTLMLRLSDFALGSATFDQYLQCWVWPKGYAHARKVCAAGAGSKDFSPGGTALEMLSVVPVLEKFLTDVVAPRRVCIVEVECALLLLRVADMLTIVNSGAVTPPALERAIVAHFGKHQ